MRVFGIALLLAISSFFAVSAVSADPHPKGFENHKFNPPEQQPRTEGGVTTFHIDPGVCSNIDYGDGRGENDCKGGNVRSVVRYTRDVPLGESVEYKFDVRIDPALAYDGFQQMAAAGIYPDGIDSHLRIASWEGPLLRNFIYMLKVDTRNGLDFLAHQCQAPADFGKWVTFSMKTLWTRDDRGWVKVTCDDKLVYADEGIATNQAPHCYPSNECEPWVSKDPSRFNFILGPVMMGFGPDWKKVPGATSMYDELQPGGVTIEVRNISITSDAKLYDEDDKATIKSLQEALTALGCDPGPADGVSGKKTRLAALTCRQFPEGVLPSKLTVATAKAFLDLYAAPETAALPAGQVEDGAGLAGLVPTEFVVHAGEDGAMKAGKDVEVNSNIIATVEGWKKGKNKVDFIILGRFDYTRGNFFKLEFILQDSVGNKVPKAPKDCYVPYITFPDGSVHASVQMQMKRATPLAIVAPKNVDCLIAALPEHQAKQMSFIIDHFADIAVGMVRDGAIGQVRHEGVKTFMQRVAAGELTVGRTPAP